MAETGTAPRDTTQQEVPTEPAGPESSQHERTVDVDPFTVEFDFGYNWCATSAELVAEDLPDRLVAQLPDGFTSLDPDDAHTAVTDLANRLSDLVELGRIDNPEQAREEVAALEEAAAQLTYCNHPCSCASDNYDTWGKEALNEALAQLGDQVWAVKSSTWHREVRYDDIDDALDLEVVYGPWSSNREGYDRCSIEWDGKALTITFSPNPTLVFTPLTEEQKYQREKWLEHDPYDNVVASRILESAPDVLDAALELWDELDGCRTDDDDPLNEFVQFSTLLCAVKTVGADLARSLDGTVVLPLMRDWMGSVTDLLATAAAIMTPAVTNEHLAAA